MKMPKLHVMLIATVLLAACASQPPAPAPAPATAATAATAPEDNGTFRKVTRDGKTLYCDNGARLGSRMAKPVCLTEDQFALWKENNRLRQDELDRVRDASAGAARAPGPGAGGK